MSGKWSDADEAAYVAATAAPIADTPREKPPEEITGDRYAAVRRVLRAGSPLTTTEYLLGQLLLVTMDVHAEIAGLRDAVDETNAYLHEYVVRGKK